MYPLFTQYKAPVTGCLVQTSEITAEIFVNCNFVYIKMTYISFIWTEPKKCLRNKKEGNCGNFITTYIYMVAEKRRLTTLLT